MSTLGFGDITFSSDLGLLFSIFVLMSGILLLLIILPFTFIQFFYAPWLEAQSKAQTPRSVPDETSGHIILTNIDPISTNLVKKLELYGYQYVAIAHNMQQAREYHDAGYNFVLGDPGDPEIYRSLQVKQAAMVVLTNNDMMNTSHSFTIREVCKDVVIVNNADMEHSVDILEFAGSTHVFPFINMLGKSLGLKTLGVSKSTMVIGKFDQLMVVEAPAMKTPLVGKNLADLKLREFTGNTVVGIWERGSLAIPTPQTMINSSSVLVLAGSLEQLEKYEKMYCIDSSFKTDDKHVLILGGGRVGRATALTLDEHDIDYKIVEKDQELIKTDHRHIHGNAADINILQNAGIHNARTVILTTHDDDINIYLTIYCRQLQPDLQIISRATSERSVDKLHRAGADLVLSYSSLGATTILNLLRPDDVFTVAQGLNVFRVPLPDSLIGETIAKSHIREQTGCSIVAINTDQGQEITPDPYNPLEAGDELIVIGTLESENKYREIYHNLTSHSVQR